MFDTGVSHATAGARIHAAGEETAASHTGRSPGVAAPAPIAPSAPYPPPVSDTAEVPAVVVRACAAAGCHSWVTGWAAALLGRCVHVLPAITRSAYHPRAPGSCP